MNANLSAVIATDRHERYISDAAEYRRSRTGRSQKSGESRRSAPSRRRRVSAFLKELSAAAL
jgi:hypothetical protein